MHRLLLLLLAALLTGPLGACESLQDARGADSVLDLFRGPRPIDVANDAIDKYNPDRRRRGTLLLASAPWAGEPFHLALYADNAQDADPAVRAAGLRALAAHGGPTHVPVLVAGLRDPDPSVRQEAARALQRVHGADAVEPLIRATVEPETEDLRLNDRLRLGEEPTRTSSGEEDPDVRQAAAIALGQYAEPRVLTALITALGDRELSVNTAALASLRTLTGQDFGYDSRAWLDWTNAHADPFAARSVFMYPIYSRPRRLIEWLPLVPKPENEVASTPAGLPAPGASTP